MYELNFDISHQIGKQSIVYAVVCITQLFVLGDEQEKLLPWLFESHDVNMLELHESRDQSAIDNLPFLLPRPAAAHAVR